LTQNSIFYTYIQPIAPTMINTFSDIDFDLDPDEIKDRFLNPQI
jgi:hypothetical protein